MAVRGYGPILTVLTHTLMHMCVTAVILGEIRDCVIALPILSDMRLVNNV